MIKSEKNRRSFGALGEKIAINYLIKSGFQIQEVNYRISRIGEIDIIARKDNLLSFIEVKTRTSLEYGLPCEAVNWKKQNTIRKLASIYIENKKIRTLEIRFDIIEIIGEIINGEFKINSINLIDNAF